MSAGHFLLSLPYQTIRHLCEVEGKASDFIPPELFVCFVLVMLFVFLFHILSCHIHLCIYALMYFTLTKMLVNDVTGTIISVLFILLFFFFYIFLSTVLLLFIFCLCYC